MEYFKRVVLKYDKQKLTLSTVFQNDPITKAVNAFNEKLNFAKLKYVEIEHYKHMETVDLNGLLITRDTFNALIEEGILQYAVVGDKQ